MVTKIGDYVSFRTNHRYSCVGWIEKIINDYMVDVRTFGTMDRITGKVSYFEEGKMELETIEKEDLVDFYPKPELNLNREVINSMIDLSLIIKDRVMFDKWTGILKRMGESETNRAGEKKGK